MRGYYKDDENEIKRGGFWSSLSITWKIAIFVVILLVASFFLFLIINNSNKRTTSNEEIVMVSEITLARNVINLKPGDSYHIDTMISPSNATDKNVTYFSDATNIIIVDESGLVTAISNGSAEVIVTSSNDKVYAICYVTVSDDTTPLTGLEISLSNINLNVGDGYLIGVTPIPAQAHLNELSFVSSNANVVTVDERGYLLAKAEGTSIITVKTSYDGKEIISTLTVTVHLNKPDNDNNHDGGTVTILPTGISLNSNSINIVVGDSYQFMAYVQPSNATNNNVTWKTSDSSIATIDAAGNVVGKKAGTTTIVATTSNGKSVSATIKVSTPPVVVPADTTKPVVTYISDSGTNLTSYPKGTVFTFICRDDVGIKSFAILDDTGDAGSLVSNTNSEIKRSVKLVTTGKRTVTTTCTDKAGNVVKTSNTFNVVADTAKPVISVSLSTYMLSLSDMSIYYKGAKVSDFTYAKPYAYQTKITVTCTDNSGVASFTAKDDTGDAGSLTTNTATKKTRVITLAKLGYRSVTASCTDNAGNTVTNNSSYVILRNEKHASCSSTTKACWHK